MIIDLRILALRVWLVSIVCAAGMTNVGRRVPDTEEAQDTDYQRRQTYKVMSVEHLHRYTAIETTATVTAINTKQHSKRH